MIHLLLTYNPTQIKEEMIGTMNNAFDTLVTQWYLAALLFIITGLFIRYYLRNEKKTEKAFKDQKLDFDTRLTSQKEECEARDKEMKSTLTKMEKKQDIYFEKLEEYKSKDHKHMIEMSRQSTQAINRIMDFIESSTKEIS